MSKTQKAVTVCILVLSMLATLAGICGDRSKTHWITPKEKTRVHRFDKDYSKD